MQAQGLNHKVSSKSTITDLVTEIDKQAERTIKEDILTNFPDHGILAENLREVHENALFVAYPFPKLNGHSDPICSFAEHRMGYSSCPLGDQKDDSDARLRRVAN